MTGRCARPPSSRPARAVAVGARGRDWRAIGARGRYWRAVGARSWRLARGGGRGRYGFRGCRPAQWAPLLRRSRGLAARSSYSIARESNASSARSSITSAASRLNRAACASRKALSSISDPCQVAARILRSCAGERIDVDQACLHAGRGSRGAWLTRSVGRDHRCATGRRSGQAVRATPTRATASPRAPAQDYASRCNNNAPLPVTSAVQPGGSNVVASSCVMIAGPASRSPRPRSARW